MTQAVEIPHRVFTDLSINRGLPQALGFSIAETSEVNVLFERMKDPAPIDPDESIWEPLPANMTPSYEVVLVASATNNPEGAFAASTIAFSTTSGGDTDAFLGGLRAVVTRRTDFVQNLPFLPNTDISENVLIALNKLSRIVADNKSKVDRAVRLNVLDGNDFPDLPELTVGKHHALVVTKHDDGTVTVTVNHLGDSESDASIEDLIDRLETAERETQAALEQAQAAADRAVQAVQDSESGFPTFGNDQLNQIITYKGRMEDIDGAMVPQVDWADLVDTMDAAYGNSQWRKGHLGDSEITLTMTRDREYPDATEGANDSVDDFDEVKYVSGDPSNVQNNLYVDIESSEALLRWDPNSTSGPMYLKIVLKHDDVANVVRRLTINGIIYDHALVNDPNNNRQFTYDPDSREVTIDIIQDELGPSGDNFPPFGSLAVTGTGSNRTWVDHFDITLEFLRANNRPIAMAYSYDSLATRLSELVSGTFVENQADITFDYTSTLTRTDPASSFVSYGFDVTGTGYIDERPHYHSFKSININLFSNNPVNNTLPPRDNTIVVELLDKGIWERISSIDVKRIINGTAGAFPHTFSLDDGRLTKSTTTSNGQTVYVVTMAVRSHLGQTLIPDFTNAPAVWDSSAGWVETLDLDFVFKDVADVAIPIFGPVGGITPFKKVPIKQYGASETIPESERPRSTELAIIARDNKFRLLDHLGNEQPLGGVDLSQIDTRDRANVRFRSYGASDVIPASSRPPSGQYDIINRDGLFYNLHSDGVETPFGSSISGTNTNPFNLIAGPSSITTTASNRLVELTGTYSIEAGKFYFLRFRGTGSGNRELSISAHFTGDELRAFTAQTAGSNGTTTGNDNLVIGEPGFFLLIGRTSANKVLIGSNNADTLTQVTLYDIVATKGDRGPAGAAGSIEGSTSRLRFDAYDTNTAITENPSGTQTDIVVRDTDSDSGQGNFVPRPFLRYFDGSSVQEYRLGIDQEATPFQLLVGPFNVNFATANQFVKVPGTYVIEENSYYYFYIGQLSNTSNIRQTNPFIFSGSILRGLTAAAAGDTSSATNAIQGVIGSTNIRFGLTSAFKLLVASPSITADLFGSVIYKIVSARGPQGQAGSIAGATSRLRFDAYGVTDVIPATDNPATGELDIIARGESFYSRKPDGTEQRLFWEADANPLELLTGPLDINPTTASQFLELTGDYTIEENFMYMLSFTVYGTSTNRPNFMNSIPLFGSIIRALTASTVGGTRSDTNSLYGVGWHVNGNSFPINSHVSIGRTAAYKLLLTTDNASGFDFFNVRLYRIVAARGERGEQGIQGEQGDQGDQGAQGVQGIQGIQGVPGVDGINPATTASTRYLFDEYTASETVPAAQRPTAGELALIARDGKVLKLGMDGTETELSTGSGGGSTPGSGGSSTREYTSTTDLATNPTSSAFPNFQVEVNFTLTAGKSYLFYLERHNTTGQTAPISIPMLADDLLALTATSNGTTITVGTNALSRRIAGLSAGSTFNIRFGRTSANKLLLGVNVAASFSLLEIWELGGGGAGSGGGLSSVDLLLDGIGTNIDTVLRWEILRESSSAEETQIEIGSFYYLVFNHSVGTATVGGSTKSVFNRVAYWFSGSSLLGKTAQTDNGLITDTETTKFLKVSSGAAGFGKQSFYLGRTATNGLLITTNNLSPGIAGIAEISDAYLWKYTGGGSTGGGSVDLSTIENFAKVGNPALLPDAKLPSVPITKVPVASNALPTDRSVDPNANLLAKRGDVSTLVDKTRVLVGSGPPQYERTHIPIGLVDGTRIIFRTAGIVNFSSIGNIATTRPEFVWRNNSNHATLPAVVEAYTTPLGTDSFTRLRIFYLREVLTSSHFPSSITVRFSDNSTIVFSFFVIVLDSASAVNINGQSSSYAVYRATNHANAGKFATHTWSISAQTPARGGNVFEIDYSEFKIDAEDYQAYRDRDTNEYYYKNDQGDFIHHYSATTNTEVGLLARDEIAKNNYGPAIPMEEASSTLTNSSNAFDNDHRTYAILNLTKETTDDIRHDFEVRFANGAFASLGRYRLRIKFPDRIRNTSGTGSPLIPGSWELRLIASRKMVGEADTVISTTLRTWNNNALPEETTDILFDITSASQDWNTVNVDLEYTADNPSDILGISSSLNFPAQIVSSDFFMNVPSLLDVSKTLTATTAANKLIQAGGLRNYITSQQQAPMGQRSFLVREERTTTLQFSVLSDTNLPFGQATLTLPAENVTDIEINAVWTLTSTPDTMVQLFYRQGDIYLPYRDDTGGIVTLRDGETLNAVFDNMFFDLVGGAEVLRLVFREVNNGNSTISGRLAGTFTFYDGTNGDYSSFLVSSLPTTRSFDLSTHSNPFSTTVPGAAQYSRGFSIPMRIVETYGMNIIYTINGTNNGDIPVSLTRTDILRTGFIDIQNDTHLDEIGTNTRARVVITGFAGQAKIIQLNASNGRIDGWKNVGFPTNNFHLRRQGAYITGFGGALFTASEDTYIIQQINFLRRTARI